MIVHEIVLALDIGSVRIGMAISDALGFMAHPLNTLKWTNTNILIDELNQVIKTKNVQRIAVGLPLNMSGQYTKQTENVNKIVDKLVLNLDIPVETIDERLTTKMAEKMLQGVGKKASKNRHVIDQIAAVNILQTYLDKKHN